MHTRNDVEATSWAAQGVTLQRPRPAAQDGQDVDRVHGG